MADPGRLREETASDLRQIRTTCPELAAATGHVRGFAAIMRERRGDRLPEWISSAAADPLPHIRQFAEGLNSDFDAVTAGLSSTWSSGQCEGQVNRAKLLKRQGHGRSGLPLLRQRILLANQGDPLSPRHGNLSRSNCFCDRPDPADPYAVPHPLPRLDAPVSLPHPPQEQLQLRSPHPYPDIRLRNRHNKLVRGRHEPSPHDAPPVS
ncbi:transposase [Streptomyces sp. WAC 06783]|uniref:transposase n=1 Tax=Streptomyces sp. WAC 06783 TaxID=2203211 RepID=UPI00163CCFDD